MHLSSERQQRREDLKTALSAKSDKKARKLRKAEIKNIRASDPSGYTSEEFHDIIHGDDHDDEDVVPQEEQVTPAPHPLIKVITIPTANIPKEISTYYEDKDIDNENSQWSNASSTDTNNDSSFIKD